MEELREAVRTAGWDAVLAEVSAAHGWGVPGDDPVLEPWRDPAAASRLGDVHESLLADRVGSGSFYTPAPLVEWVLDRVLADAGTGTTVLDPACGTGNFLLAVVRRLGPDAAARVHGTDLDPVAVAISRLLLRIEAPGVDPAVLRANVRVADGLGDHPGAPYDAVVGNPPFGGRLRPRGPVAARAPGAYTDTSAVFFQRALDLVRPGGSVAMVQPLSLLAARDAGPVRDAVRASGAVVDFWSSRTPVFTGTAVLTCVPVVRIGVPSDEGLPLPHDEWGTLHAPALGVPSVAPRADGVLGDLGPCTADFRDQYYGLVPHVREGGPGAPLVTSGLIDPARCRWGETPTRFVKQAWRSPTVDLQSLRAEGTLAAWADARLVPKVLVAPQGRVLEAVVDVDGRWLPSVPVVTVVPPPELLWHVLAVLLAPPVVALAAARYAGTALAATAIKLSARQVAALPLPADHGAWDDAAHLARVAQAVPDDEQPEALRAVAERMCEAYDDRAALGWWETQVRSRRPSPRVLTGDISSSSASTSRRRD
ncbi:N-6 DNA methylase [Nocardioides sp. C4-1]|uniref:HsdM family class I SAM-dependent methyltransferase n=1 Tax=Nocardioides sp. C4-1 TaxID=3151851 RepID=UPI003265821C